MIVSPSSIVQTFVNFKCSSEKGNDCSSKCLKVGFSIVYILKFEQHIPDSEQVCISLAHTSIIVIIFKVITAALFKYGMEGLEAVSLRQ